MYPEMKLPMMAPRATSDPIQELCSLLIGDPKGPPSFSNSGRTGLVHPSTAPAAATLRLPVEKSALQFPQAGKAEGRVHFQSTIKSCHLRSGYRKVLIRSSRI